MSAAGHVFNDHSITTMIKDKLKSIRKLNLEKGLIYLQDRENELFSVLPREELKTVMLKVDKKKSINTVIEMVREDLKYILNCEDDIIDMAYEINTYNNIVYVKRKY